MTAALRDGIEARPAALRAERLDASGWAAAQADPALLGGIAWGTAAGLGLPVLAPAGGRVDAWFGDAAARHGRHGEVYWRDDGQLLFGGLDLPDAGGDLGDTAHRAYLALFAALREAGRPQLLRLWNYLPRINEEQVGLERYRQFNIGRQRAFLDTGHDAFEGAPAACAIGTRGGPLRIRFLAARSTPLAVENPRQVPAYRYSAQFGPRAPSFSRAVLAEAGGGRLALLISGTASIVGEHSLHAGDVHAQLGETLANLRAVIAAAEQRCTARFALGELDCTVYLRHADHLDPIRQGFEAAVGAGSRAAAGAVYLEADICRSELLVEIEAHGHAAGVLCR